MDNINISTIALEYTKLVQDNLLELMMNQEKLELQLGQRTKIKTQEHTAYLVDDFSNNILFELLNQYSEFNWQVFSEETGWTNIGNGKIRLKAICDPFCNTSLAMRGFRESAVAICITDDKNELISCSIADLNIKRIFYVDKLKSVILNPGVNGQWTETEMHVSKTQNLKNAFIAISALKAKRRQKLTERRIFHEAGQITILDGAIYIARMASGYLDAYLDLDIGQPIYEIPCLEMIKRSGGVVKDLSGKDFELAQVVFTLEEKPDARYQFISASTNELYKEILESI